MFHSNNNLNCVISKMQITIQIKSNQIWIDASGGVRTREAYAMAA